MLYMNGECKTIFSLSTHPTPVRRILSGAGCAPRARTCAYTRNAAPCRSRSRVDKPWGVSTFSSGRLSLARRPILRTVEPRCTVLPHPADHPKRLERVWTGRGVPVLR
jgi:hypothetical protein